MPQMEASMSETRWELETKAVSSCGWLCWCLIDLFPGSELPLHLVTHRYLSGRDSSVRLYVCVCYFRWPHPRAQRPFISQWSFYLLPSSGMTNLNHHV